MFVVVVEGELVLVQGRAGMEVDWQLQSRNSRQHNAHIRKCCFSCIIHIDINVVNAVSTRDRVVDCVLAK